MPGRKSPIVPLFLVLSVLAVVVYAISVTP